MDEEFATQNADSIAKIYAVLEKIAMQEKAEQEETAKQEEAAKQEETEKQEEAAEQAEEEKQEETAEQEKEAEQGETAEQEEGEETDLEKRSQRKVASEGEIVRLETAVQQISESDYGDMFMGTMDVTFSQTESRYWGQMGMEQLRRDNQWNNYITSHEKSGYEWTYLCVDIETIGDTSGGMFFYNWEVECKDSKDWTYEGEALNFSAETRSFTVTWNGKEYPECKMLMFRTGDIDWADNGEMGQAWTDEVCMLLPEGYDEDMCYTVYGTTLNADGVNTTINKEESVSYIF